MRCEEENGNIDDDTNNQQMEQKKNGRINARSFEKKPRI